MNDARARVLAAVERCREAHDDWDGTFGSANRKWKVLCAAWRELGYLWRDVEALLREEK